MNLNIQNQLVELEFLSQKIDFVDDFTELYERLLAGYLVRKDQTTAKRIRSLAGKQVEFLANELSQAAVEEGLLQ